MDYVSITLAFRARQTRNFEVLAVAGPKGVFCLKWMKLPDLGDAGVWRERAKNGDDSGMWLRQPAPRRLPSRTSSTARGMFPPETKSRVEDAIRGLNYRPHGVARSLRSSRTGTIGVMVSDIANPFFADLVLGVEDVVHLDARGYNFILCNTEESRDKERMYFEVLQQKRVDGLILAPAGGNADKIREMITQGLPLVCVDRELAGVEADTIVVDNRAAARTLVTHLINVGHRRIAALRANSTRIRLTIA